MHKDGGAQILRTSQTCHLPCHIVLLSELRDVNMQKLRLKYEIKFD